MKLALIGYGKMGRAIEKAALARGHSISAIISPSSQWNKISDKSLAEADLCIDFSHPDCILDNIQQTALLGKNLIVGTTGWYSELDQVKQIVDKQEIGLLYAPNFSIGVQLFLKIVSAAASMLNRLEGSGSEQYDIAITEAHHNQKVDSPSGTAKALANLIAEEMHRDAQGLPISSIRCGAIPGTHTVLIDSPHRYNHLDSHS